MSFTFKKMIARSTSPCGTFVFSSDAASTEIAAMAGFEFVIVDREHTPLSWSHVQDHVRAGAVHGIPVLVRIRRPDGDEVSHALDTGAQGVVVPHFGLDREASRDCVRSVRYAPAGDRGTCSGTRASGYGLGDFPRVVEEANRGAAVVVQIEDAQALAEIETLLAEIPVDAVMPGMADLATSLGHPGIFDHPEVVAAAERVFGAASAAHLPVGLYIANASQLSRWAGHTASFHVYAIDHKVLAEGYHAARNALLLAAATPIEQAG